MDSNRKYACVRRMTNARMILLREYPFFGNLLLRLQFACAPCGTACTDGRHLIFDPEFAAKLSDEEIRFVMLHEVLHCVLNHIFRTGGRMRDVYNLACDIVVNSIIMEMWGVKSFLVAGEEPMHIAPDGREGACHSAEEVYDMLLRENKGDKGRFAEEFGSNGDDAFPGHIDCHDTWEKIENVSQLQDTWDWNIREAAALWSDGPTGEAVIRRLEEDLMHRSSHNWKQILHDFICYDAFDYSYIIPDRRYWNSDYMMPSFQRDEDAESVRDLWVCVDTSASMSRREITECMSEILSAMEQTGLKGQLSFFDHRISDPIAFCDEDDLKKIVPVGGGGTSYAIIFSYMKEHMTDQLPRAILIYTDGFAPMPDERESLQVPVLWIITKGGYAKQSWGEVIQLECMEDTAGYDGFRN